MIKRTLYFGNPAYLSCRNEQMLIQIPANKETGEEEKNTSAAIEDLGVVVIDNYQVSITHHLLHRLLENNVALITCDDKHMPAGLMYPLAGNQVQTERFALQIEASIPLKKQLWQQTVKKKIENQAALLALQGEKADPMLYWAENVKSGDTDNHEARAAAYYWPNLMKRFDPMFTRDTRARGINMLLNYGYALVRATVARCLVAAGLLPTLGIHHHNRYNAFCLADDIMEPYRPYVDQVVLGICMRLADAQNLENLNREIKQELLSVITLDVKLEDEISPLAIAVQRTANSLYRCFSGEVRKILYPEFN
jgi:CRISP-associated protein Cas1